MSPALVPSLAQENLAEDPLLVRLPRDTEGRPMLAGCHLVCNLLKGGMEAIYYALDERHDVEVAIRVLPLALVDRDEGLNARLSDQARIAQGLWSPYLVRVLDFGRDQGLHYVIMEYVPGESAGVRLRSQMMRGMGGLPEGEALLCIAGAALGLADIHAAALVHRDVRPDNILIQRVGRPLVKLTGLGLAKPQGQGFAVGRLVHFAMGTPGFLAPEQAQDWRNAGPPADVFSLGATLFALLAGYPPFTGSSLLGILKATNEKDPDELPYTVRQPVREFILRCLNKKPDRRFANGREVVDALARVDQDAVAQALEADQMEMPSAEAPAPEAAEVTSAPSPEPEPPVETPADDDSFTKMTILPPPPEGSIRMGTPEPPPAPARRGEVKLDSWLTEEDEQAPAPPPTPEPPPPAPPPRPEPPPPPPAAPPLEKHTAQLEDWMTEPEETPAPKPAAPPPAPTLVAAIPPPAPAPAPAAVAPPPPPPVPISQLPPPMPVAVQGGDDDRIPAPVPVALTESAQRRYILSEHRRRRWANVANTLLILAILAATLAAVWFLFRGTP